jgi:hypothetical protein
MGKRASEYASTLCAKSIAKVPPIENTSGCGPRPDERPAQADRASALLARVPFIVSAFLPWKANR